MDKLIILSEIDCLELMQSKGIMPSEYYTDFETFKDRSSIFNNCIVVCLLAGTSHFSKRRLIELCKNLSKSINSEYGSGIKDIYILSDCILGNCDSYYLYRELPVKFDWYKHWQCKRKDIEFWSKLQYEPCSPENCVKYYSNYDKADTMELENKINNRYRGMDDLIEVIQKPDLSMLKDTVTI